MNLKENKEWQQIVETNKDDYGKACIDVAKEAMKLLSKDITPLHAGYYPDRHTPHGIICLANRNTHTGGILGFMAGYVAQMIVKFHDRGEEFRVIWNGNKETSGVTNLALATVISKKDFDIN